MFFCLCYAERFLSSSDIVVYAVVKDASEIKQRRVHSSVGTRVFLSILKLVTASSACSSHREPG